MPLTFGGKPVAGTRAATIQPRDEAPATPSPSTDNDVVIFLYLLARSLEARGELQDVVSQLREIDVDALHDPAFEDHPRRPAMLALYEDRIEAEKLAAIRLMEDNTALSRQWRSIDSITKNRYGLTFLVGEPDPDQEILLSLWCRDRGIALLVPFPDRWAIPYELSYRALDDSTGVRTYDIEEVLRHAQPSF